MKQKLVLKWEKDPIGGIGAEAIFLGKWKIARHYTNFQPIRSTGYRRMALYLPGMKSGNISASGKEEARKQLEKKVTEWFEKSGLNFELEFE